MRAATTNDLRGVMVVGECLSKPRLPDSRPSRPSTTPRCLWAGRREPAPAKDHRVGLVAFPEAPPRPAPNPSPSPSGTPGPAPSRAGRGRRAAASGRALGSADSGRAEGSGRSRQAARAAAPGLTHRGAGRSLPRATGATAARARSAPSPPSSRLALRLRLAPHSRPRVLPTAPEPPALSASQVRAAARPGLPGRDDRAGPGARRGAWAGGGGGGPSSLGPRAAATAGGGAPAPGSRRSPRRHRRQSARGGESRGQLLPPRAASRVRPRPSGAWAARVSSSRAPLFISVKGTRNVQQVRAVIIIFRRSGPPGVRAPDVAAGSGASPASSASRLALCVAGDRPWPAGGGRRPETPGLQELFLTAPLRRGAGLPRGMRLVTSLQPLQESQRDGRAGLAGISGCVFIFICEVDMYWKGNRSLAGSLRVSVAFHPAMHHLDMAAAASSREPLWCFDIFLNRHHLRSWKCC